MIKNYLLVAFALVIVGLLLMKACEKPAIRPKELVIRDTIKVLESKVAEVKKEVVKWKQAKTKVVYITKFDTLATIDTVLVELTKCDQVVKMDSVIIAGLDSIVATQDVQLQFKDKQLKEAKKTTRKEKRKAFLSGLVIGYALGLITPL